MIFAVILAGGSGIRMEREIPKQFIEVGGKPILAYTLDRFQKHPVVDEIVVVCVSGWEDYTRKMAEKYGFSKMTGVVTGGDSALSSIRKGVEAIQGSDDDIVIVHDGVRPLVDVASIDAVIADCKVYGGAISSVPLVEHIVHQGANRQELNYIPREKAFRTLTPQAYRLGNIIAAYRKAETTGIGLQSSFIGTMMMDIGEPVVLSRGSERNIKITDPKDLVYFESMFAQ